MAEQISRGFVSTGKHTLKWNGLNGHMKKDNVKLVLNLVAASMTALPRGGEIDVTMAGTLEEPSFLLRCKGTSARAPQYLTEFIIAKDPPELNAMSIQAYYTWRLARTAGMRLEILQDGDDIILSARQVV